MKIKTAVDYEMARAMIDEWEYMRERLEKPEGRFLEMDPETREQTIRTVDNILRFLRKETAA